MLVAIEIGFRDRVADLVIGPVSSSKPPSTDCSASIECGGMRKAAIAGSIGVKSAAAFSGIGPCA